MNRNSYIELLRFIASIFIALFHVNVTPNGWIFTEFFFMLSGYFAFKAVEAKKIGDSVNEPLIYTLNAVKKIFPYTFLSMLMLFVVRINIYKLTTKEILRFFGNFIESITLLNGTNIILPYFVVSDDYCGGEMFLGPLWYICALFVAMPIMIFLVRCYYSKVGIWLVSFLPLFIDGYILFHNGTILGYHMNMMFFFTLDLRALAGLLFGGAICCLSKKISLIQFNVLGRIILGIIELLLIFLCFLLAISSEAQYTLLWIMALIISLSITFSEKSFTSIIHHKFLNYLGNLSISIYCSHFIVIETVGYDTTIKYIIEVIFLGVVFQLLVSTVKRLNIGTRIKQLVILK